LQYKYEFKTDEERQLIIEQNKELYLIEVQNITEGNFLIFSDTPNMVVEQEIMTHRDLISKLEANFMYDSMMKDLSIEESTNQQADLLYQLMMKGVL